MNTNDTQTALERAAAAIRTADALLITAGAGMGVDSGLPDFRGNTGFWKAYPPLEALGVSFQDMANPDGFRRDPELAWGFYGHRLQLYRDTEPHSGFQILRKWANRASAGWFIFTSNVDGQFQKAGFAADHVVECHGSIHHLQCQVRRGIWSANGVNIEIDHDTLHARSLPMCACCDRVARPNILMFGDLGWDPTRSQAQHTVYRAWRNSLRQSARLVIVEIGAGTNIATVRSEGEEAAIEHNATLIRINPREPAGPGSTISVQKGAKSALELIDALVSNSPSG